MPNDTIHVEFVDASTGQTFAVADVPPENLPDSFERSTTMHLGSDDWRVVKAEPMTAAEFKQTGKLRLILTRVMQMPVKNILYTLPTICDAIPSVIPNTNIEGQNAFRLHEDNWRQVEFVAETYRADIIDELRDINAIYEQHSVPGKDITGFNQLHPRKRIATPIQTQLTVQQVRDYLPAEAQPYEVVGYDRSPEVVGGAFAMRAAPLVIYGHAGKEGINTLALEYIANPGSISSVLLESLARLMSENHFALVDWVHVQLMAASAESLRDYFGKFS